MIKRLSDPQSVFGLWMVIGLVLGLSFGQAINSMTIGIPMGLATSFLMGKVSYRLSKGISRLMR